MTDKPKPPPKVEVLNPRYAGATPGMVARALMRQKPKGGGKAKPSRVIADRPARSSI
ncbi:MAG: hypothetical protein OXH59_09505 [Rhodospirillaceae bacterium]|nr:hypothetical protein [Rhodospirillaceae bacterium]